MGGSLIVLFLLPFINTSEIRSTVFRPLYKIAYWLLVVSFLILGWIGQMPVDYPFVEVGIVAMIYYFSFFIILVPVIGIVENNLIRYNNTKNDIIYMSFRYV